MTLLEVVDALGLDRRLHGESPHVTAGWVGIICPYCGEGTGKYGLGINLQYGAVRCWKCGPHRLVETLTEAAKCPESNVRRLLEPFWRNRSPSPPNQGVTAGGKLRWPRGIDTLRAAHKEYLNKRRCLGKLGNWAKIAELWKVQGIGPIAPLAWRVVLPVEVGGKPVSWTSRAISDDNPNRWWSAKPEEEVVLHKSVLFGEDFCRHAVVVTEGPFDAINIGPGAVATMGTGYTNEQAARLGRYAVRVVCFDNEPEAQRRARDLLDKLGAMPGRTLKVELDAEDPGEADENEVKQLRKAFLD